MANRLRESLESGAFVITCEILPGRGASEPAQQLEFEKAVSLYDTGKVHAISLTDNPGGNPALAADTFARDLSNTGVTTLVHCTCKDKSRNQLQAQLYAMQRHGLDNLLVMTGDYQCSGWSGRSRPVFDLDPVHLLQLIQSINEGLVAQNARDTHQEQPAQFYAGAVVSPFKWTEGETIPQYLKLEKKILAGARFIISQLGYDARKMEELVSYVRSRGYQTPLIANVYLLTLGAARYMQGGNIAGAYVSNELIETLAQEAKEPDKGKAARVLRAAKMLAVARGLGYAGVHIGGAGLNAEVLGRILSTANALQEQWPAWAQELHYGKPEGFYLSAPRFDRDGATTGLNGNEPTPRLESYRGKKGILKNYGLSRFLHYWALTRNRRFYGALAQLMERRDTKRGINRRHGLEHLSKTVLYGCLDCGDCGLEACVYSCPMSQCPKCQRNGPCGGSADGWCEVYPQERYCLYVKAYHRLKKHGELAQLDAYLCPPVRWELNGTSSWSNYTHERDNAAHRTPLPAPHERAAAACATHAVAPCATQASATGAVQSAPVAASTSMHTPTLTSAPTQEETQ